MEPRERHHDEEVREIDERDDTAPDDDPLDPDDDDDALGRPVQLCP